MRLAICGTLLLICWIVTGCSETYDGPIVGRWASVSEADAVDSYAREYEFSPDGDITITLSHPILGDTSFVASYEMKWDSVLTIKDERETDQVIATIVNDTLAFRSAEGTVKYHTRLE